jgi:Tol biopolymer transport system component
MKMWRFGLALGVVALVLVPLAAQQVNQSLDAELRRAAQKEVVSGDLKAAIDTYKSIVARAGADHVTAAKALLRLAEAYQKLGDKQAQNVHERIVLEYGDQKEIVAAAKARLGNSDPPEDAAPRSRQLWTGEGDTVSADGRYVSYASAGDVFIRDVTAKTDRRLTDRISRPRPADYAEITAIARDGGQVAYSWSNVKTLRYELRVIAAHSSPGSGPKILVDNPDITFITPLDWSADGQTIAARLGRADHTSQIALVAVKDGKLTVLKSIDWRGPIKAMFSPDGQYLAYDLVVDDKSDQRDVFVISRDATREAHVVDHHANDLLAGWSPDGRWLLFASDRSGSIALWGLPMADGRPTGTPSLLRADLGSFVGSLGMTRTGALLHVRRTKAVKVYSATVDFVTGKVVTPGAPVFETYLRGQRGPVWSWDGKMMAWSSPLPSGQPGVGVMTESLETGRVTEVAAELSGGVLRTWAPDGSLTYHGTDVKGRPGIFRIDPHDGHATPIAIADEGFFALPDWSSDGKRLVYRHQTASGGVMMLRDVVAGIDRELLRSRPFGLFAIAPDGKSIAYLEPLQGARSLTLLTVDSGATRNVLTLPETETFSSLQWLPDSRRIVVWKSVHGNTTGSVIALDGGAAVQLDPAIPEDSRIHPDGRRIAYTAGTATHEVWALENFLPAATASRK